MEGADYGRGRTNDKVVGGHRLRYWPLFQLCDFTSTDFYVSDGPAALLRRPVDKRALRLVKNQVGGRGMPFGIEHIPFRVLLDPSQTACIVILEHRSGGELPGCGLLIGSRQRSQRLVGHLVHDVALPYARFTHRSLHSDQRPRRPALNTERQNCE
jgi:hypothetical protein